MRTRDELWCAYLDGEMSPAEAAEYARAMTPEEREQSARDLEMQSGLAEYLAAPAPCPVRTWKTALLHVKQERHIQERHIQKVRPSWLVAGAWAAVAVAAVAVVSVVAFFPERQQPKPLFLALKGQDVSAVAAKAQVNDGVSSVRAFMQERALPVALDPSDALDGENAPYKLIGVREDQYHGERLVQLIFDCQGQPAVLVIAQSAGIAAREIGDALARGSVRASRSIGSVVIAVVGVNAPRELIRVIDDHWPDPQPAVEAGSPAEPEAPPSDGLVQPPEEQTVQDPSQAAPHGLPTEEPMIPTPEPDVVSDPLPEMLATPV